MKPPEGLVADFSLARLTTVRAGGRADHFAAIGSEEALIEALAFAAAEGLAVGVVGSGSNLLVSDEGFRGLVIKLEGDLATIERDGERLLCGGGGPPPPGPPPPRPPGGAPRRMTGSVPKGRTGTSHSGGSPPAVPLGVERRSRKGRAWARKQRGQARRSKVRPRPPPPATDRAAPPPDPDSPLS
jgi:hypothetical protein